MKKIVLPEYGRNIQQMAQYILTIEDRERRNQAAHEIIAIMGNMTPQYRESRDFKQKLWDHFALMTNYQLDIEYPFEINKKNELKRTEKLPYSSTNIPLRHYGKIVHQMVIKATTLQNEEEKKDLILMIANQMKKLYVQWNNNSVNDEVIFQDLKILSGGKICITEETKLSNVRVFTPTNNLRPKSNNNHKNLNNNNNNKGKFKKKK